MSMRSNFAKCCSVSLSAPRSEEHTSELQSHLNLVCRLLLEKKKHKKEHQQHLNLLCRLLRAKYERRRRALRWLVLSEPERSHLQVHHHRVQLMMAFLDMHDG